MSIREEEEKEGKRLKVMQREEMSSFGGMARDPVSHVVLQYKNQSQMRGHPSSWFS